MPTSQPAQTLAERDWRWVVDPRRSLRSRAALLVGGGTLLFTIAFAWVTSSVLRRSIETQLGTQFEAMAFQVGDKLDRAIYERYRTLLVGSSLSVIRNHSAPPAERRQTLQALQEGSPELAWIGIADPNGQILASTGGLFEGSSAMNRAWFRSAREMPYAGPLREIPELARAASANVSAESDAPPRFLDLAVPLAGPDGTFAGVLGAHLRWNWTRDVQLSVVPEPLTRDRIGVTVYSGNDPLLDSGASGWSHPPHAPAIGELRRARGSLIEQTSLGTTYITGFARSRGFKEFRGLGWLIVVRQPVDRAFAMALALRRTIVVWGAALSLVAAIATWFLVSRHAWRLRSVRAAATRIHEGDILAVLPRPPGESELARMCHALSDLVEDLRARSAARKDPAPPPPKNPTSP